MPDISLTTSWVSYFKFLLSNPTNPSSLSAPSFLKLFRYYFPLGDFGPLDRKNKWIKNLPEILVALKLAFPISKDTIVIPSAISKLSMQKLGVEWASFAALDNVYCLGRRLKITEETLMFNPSLLSQLTCDLLFRFGHARDPHAWQGGLVFSPKSGDAIIGLFLHGGYVPEKSERRHGEPERFKTFDILVKAKTESKGSELLEKIFLALEDTTKTFSPNLKWETSVMFPTSVSRYFSIRHKRDITTLPFRSQPSPLQHAPWSMIEEQILKGDSPSSDLNLSYFRLEHFACIGGRKDLLQGIPFLDVNSFSQHYPSPVFLAAQNGQISIFEYLVLNFQSIDLESSWKSLNPQEIADDEGFSSVARFLEDFRKQPIKFRRMLRGHCTLLLPFFSKKPHHKAPGLLFFSFLFFSFLFF